MTPHEARLLYEALTKIADRIETAYSVGTPDFPLSERERYGNKKLRDIAEYIDVQMSFARPSLLRKVC